MSQLDYFKYNIVITPIEDQSIKAIHEAYLILERLRKRVNALLNSNEQLQAYNKGLEKDVETLEETNKELLEACKKMILALYNDSPDSAKEIYAASVQMEQAVAKAEGKQ